MRKSHSGCAATPAEGISIGNARHQACGQTEGSGSVSCSRCNTTRGTSPGRAVLSSESSRITGVLCPCPYTQSSTPVLYTRPEFSVSQWRSRGQLCSLWLEKRGGFPFRMPHLSGHWLSDCPCSSGKHPCCSLPSAPLACSPDAAAEFLFKHD